MRAFAASMFILCACASTLPRLPVPALSSAVDADDPLIAAFYDASPFDAPTFEALLATALRERPRSAAVHEVAMQRAKLRGDHDAAFMHALHAAAATRSPLAAWFVSELDRNDRTVSEMRAAIELTRAIYASDAPAAVRAEAAITLASLLASFDERDEAQALNRWLGYMSQFLYIGPFDNDQGKGFATPYPPEQTIDAAKTYPGKILPIGWRPLRRLNEEAAVWLDDVISPAEHAVTYFATFVRAGASREVLLHVRCGAALKILVNDQVVFSEEKLGAGRNDNITVPLRLEAGWHKLVFKIAGQRSTAFAARFSDNDGGPIELEASNVPKTMLAAAHVIERPVGLAPAIATFASPGRRAFWQTREVYRSGRQLDVVPAHEAAAQAMRGHPLAIFEGALAYWDNDELGKAIDLLGKGTERFGDVLPAFLQKRARFYRQKKQLDKAQRDLERAVERAPKSRFLWMDLADLLDARGLGPERTRVLTKVLGEWPDSVWAKRELADAWSSRGYTQRAEVLHREIARLLPGENRGWQRLVDRDVQRGDLDAAIDRLREMQARQPLAHGLVMQEADLWRRNDRPEEATALLTRVATQDPDWARPYERLAVLYDEQGKKDATLAEYKRALARDPKNSTLRERVDLLEPQGKEYAEKYVPGEAEIDAIVAGAAAVKIEAGAHVVLLSDHEVTEVAQDGSSKRFITLVAKALDDQGRDALTHTSLPSHGTTKLLRAYSVNKRGDRQELSSVQGDALRFRQLEVGSIVVLQYIWYAPPQAFLPNHFASSWRFESVHRQHEKATWVLIMPEGRALNVQIRGAIKREDRREDGRDVRVFTAEHVPALIAEPFMPPQDDLLASVDVSTLQDWSEYVRWERALLVDAFRSSPAIEALAQRLTADKKTPQAKLDAILHFVAREIRYQQEYETTIAGVRPHACPVVVERGYGDCKDKSVLLIRLAKLAGLTAEMALLRTTNAGAVQKAIPNQQFNHAIVYVPKQAGLPEGFFIDATTEGLDLGNLRNDDQGATALVLDAEGDGFRFVDIPYQAPALEREEHAMTMTIASDTQATANDLMTLRGASAAQLRVLLRNEQVARKTFENVGAYLFPGSSLTSTSAKNHEDIVAPLEVSLSLDVSTSLTREGSRMRIKVPAPVSLLRAGTLVKRKTDLILGVPSVGVYRHEITLPEGHRVAHLPEPFMLEHACFSAKRTSEAKDRKVQMTLTIERRCARVKAEDYPAFREVLQKLTNATQQELVFEKKLMAHFDAPPAAAPRQ